MDQIIPGADKDIVTPLHKRIAKQYEDIFLKAKVTKVEAEPDGLVVTLRGRQRPRHRHVRQDPGRGRPPAQRQADRRRERRRDRRRARLHPGRQAAAHQRRRTSSPSATSSASRCWPTRRCTRARSPPRAAAGKNSFFDATVIPSVAYTDPEVAWVGVTENEAKAEGRQVRQGRVPLGRVAAARCRSAATRASPRSCSTRPRDRIIGCGIVGPSTPAT